jgi:hypothetical protein
MREKKREYLDMNIRRSQQQQADILRGRGLGRDAVGCMRTPKSRMQNDEVAGGSVYGHGLEIKESLKAPSLAFPLGYTYAGLG